MTYVGDSLKLDIPRVMDLSGESHATSQLLEEVMNSEILTEVIKSESLDGRVAATAVVTTSEDGDTSAGEGMKQKGRGGRKKQSSDEKAVPLRRSERRKKTEPPNEEIIGKEEEKNEKVRVKKKDKAKLEVKTEEDKEEETKGQDETPSKVKDETPSKVKDAKETSRKGKRTKLSAQKAKFAKSAGNSEDGDGEDTGSQGSETAKDQQKLQEVKRKRTSRKRRQSKEEQQDLDDEDEDNNKSLKKLQEEIKSMKASTRGGSLKEGHQPRQEGSQQGVEEGEVSLGDTPNRGSSQPRDTRRRSDDGQSSRSDHTYERRRSGSTSEQAPSLFTPDNAVFIKLGSPKDGEGGRTMETRRRDRPKSWSELKTKGTIYVCVCKREIKSFRT